MIEQIIETIVQELGAQGLLIVGLYFLLYKPLKRMASSLHIINGEIGEILALLKTAHWHKHK